MARKKKVEENENIEETIKEVKPKTSRKTKKKVEEVAEVTDVVVENTNEEDTLVIAPLIDKEKLEHIIEMIDSKEEDEVLTEPLADVTEKTEINVETFISEEVKEEPLVKVEKKTMVKKPNIKINPRNVNLNFTSFWNGQCID